MLWRTLRTAARAKSAVRPSDPTWLISPVFRARLIVELDGRPHDDPERRDRDLSRDAWLAEQGWRVLRIPNDIVIGGGDIVVDRIKAALPRFPSSDPR